MVLAGTSKKYFAWIFLIWTCGEHGCVGFLQSMISEGRPCQAPTLDGGYIVPEQDIYSHGATLSFACEKGLKPATQGWWATTTCLDGKWATQPQCIDINNCIPPFIPNGKFTWSASGWYENGFVIRVKCDAGYSYKNYDATASCVNGTWLSVPTCERSQQACDAPPKIPHAVIINNPHQDVYASDTELLFECEDGFTVEGTQKKAIFCIFGTWSPAPPCVKGIKPTPGGSTASTGSGTIPSSGGRRPGSGSGNGGRDHAGTSTGTSSTHPQVTTIDRCGDTPVVADGEIMKRTSRFLKYQCGSFYKRVGPEKVVCYANGQWSATPTCKATYCSVDQHPRLKFDGVKFLTDGETVELECVNPGHWLTTHYSVVRCNNGRIILGKCCNWWERKFSSC
ncbi:complement factor H-like [Corythoichthys intestinalis]|uniref:complement factor H-like n=1 Tax=Corythoichthys intestinalis TaxID=161448 RepID=UPI0025A4EDFA|nr:complement factor H-like [Corythoichthys intestinalis]